MVPSHNNNIIIMITIQQYTHLNVLITINNKIDLHLYYRCENESIMRTDYKYHKRLKFETVLIYDILIIDLHGC